MAEHFISRDEAESDLLACAAYIAESIESADGHAEATSAVVQRYLAKGEVDLAAELANSVDDPFTRDRLLIHVAEKCAQADDDEYARQLVEATKYAPIGNRGKGGGRAVARLTDLGWGQRLRTLLGDDGVGGVVAQRQLSRSASEGLSVVRGHLRLPLTPLSQWHYAVVESALGGVHGDGGGLTS